MLLPVDDERRVAADDVEHLFLVASGLVVLRDLLPGRYVDDVHAERGDAERPADEPPAAGRLTVVEVSEVDADVP
jgi:hypothetical protein